MASDTVAMVFAVLAEGYARRPKPRQFTSQLSDALRTGGSFSYRDGVLDTKPPDEARASDGANGHHTDAAEKRRQARRRLLGLVVAVIVLGVFVALVLILAVGGAIARKRQLERTQGRFDEHLAQVNRDLAAAHAQDRGWARETLDAAAQAAKLTFIKSGERPIMPHVVRAHCSIMSRRCSSSGSVRGIMNDKPTRSPVVGET